MRKRGFRRWLVLCLGVVALLSLVVEFGFELDARTEGLLRDLDLLLATAFALELLLALPGAPRKALRERWYEYLLLLLFVAALGALAWMEDGQGPAGLFPSLRLSRTTRTFQALVQGFALAEAIVHVLRAQEGLLVRDVRPERVFVGGFAILVLAGTVLLSLPEMAAEGARRIVPIDALFTATSAVCVTGLTVRDTGHDFSVLGQSVLLALIQVGGLGIVTFVAFLSAASGRAFTVPQLVALRQITNASSLADVSRHVRWILLTALSIEGLGAAWLFATATDPGGALPGRLFWSAFHAVSAFCNAGFALQSDGLRSFRGAWPVLSCFMVLIVLGGLGAPTARNLLEVAGWRLRHLLGRAPQGSPRPRLRVQTRLSLWLTGALVVGGALAILACELGGILRGVGRGEGVLIALFQSVTARTAGFDTVRVESLQQSTLLVLVFLMVVGAGPVSTGGGIKTVTFGVLLLSVRSMVRGTEVEAFGRTIPRAIVRAATAISVAYVLTAGLVTFLLCLTDPAVPFIGKLFEAVSALSTVGLSTGITAGLSAGGKLVLCLAMFCGRIGPLALAITVIRSRSRKASYRYPEEGMVLG